MYGENRRVGHREEGLHGRLLSVAEGNSAVWSMCASSSASFLPAASISFDTLFTRLRAQSTSTVTPQKPASIRIRTGHPLCTRNGRDGCLACTGTCWSSNYTYTQKREKHVGTCLNTLDCNPTQLDSVCARTGLQTLPSGQLSTACFPYNRRIYTPRHMQHTV